MKQLSPFWMAAAHLSGRLDLSGCLMAGVDPETASCSTLEAHGVPSSLVTQLRSQDWLVRPLEALCLTDSAYPEHLRLVPFAPPVLFAQGDRKLLTEPAVSIVGARRCSEHARRFAFEISAAVAEAGGVVVSGLAWGIDEAAHRGAAGRTIAVVAQGLGVPFRGSLYRRAAELQRRGGLILSEFPPDRSPARHLFLQRNRVISGLGRSTVVVEAGERSGSLVTARCALEQGRDLFVVPDHPSRAAATGGLRLLESGATPLLSARSILESLDLKAVARNVYDEFVSLVDIHGTPAALAAHTGESLRAWNRRLARLELSGQVERLPGGRYVPCRSVSH